MGRPRNAEYVLATFIVAFMVGKIHTVQRPMIGFYDQSCATAETIVRLTVQNHLNNDPTIATHILRLHFNDCFVRGCDGSVLIEGENSERTAPPNLPLRGGFPAIEEAKTLLEAICPSTVSCADILAMAARDVVSSMLKTTWAMPLGRLDGRISQASEVNLPSPFDHILVLKEKLAAKGLDATDLVTLVGRRVIETNQVMQSDPKIRAIMERFLDKGIPNPLSARSFTKLSLIDIKTSPTQGEIRKTCSMVNRPII